MPQFSGLAGITAFGVPVVILVIAVGLAVAAFMFFGALVPQKSDVAKRLEAINNLSFENKNERREGFARIFNEKQTTGLKARMHEAGWYTVSTGQVGMQVIACGVVGLTLGVVFLLEMGTITPVYVGGVLLLTFGGAYVPFSRLSSAAKKRKVEIQKALPDFLDMLSSTVQAGLSFNAALSEAVGVAKGPLGEEIKAALSEVRLGRPRADALRSMMNRVKQEQLTTVVTSLIQAEKLGANMSTILEELSAEVRNRRMTRAEEIANLMPTKMVIPMALFMLPALFVMIFGGVFAQYLAGPH